MIKRAGLAAIAMCGLMMATAQRATAQETPAGEPTQEQRDLARQHYEAGKKHHDAGEYDAAAAEYAKAYDIYPMPVLIYNIGQVKRLGGNKKEALAAYENYLELEPNGPGADNAREFVDTLRKAIDSGVVTEPPVEPKDDPANNAAPIEPEVPSFPPQDPGAGRVKRLSGIAIGGIGLIAVGIGIKFGMDARSLSGDTEELEGEWDPAQEEIWDDGEAAERNMLVLTSVGLAAVAGGTVLYLLGLRDARRARERSLTVTPIAGPAGAGASVSWSF
jgi:tetratricopeptide (TPR) repeat protein